MNIVNIDDLKFTKRRRVCEEYEQKIKRLFAENVGGAIEGLEIFLAIGAQQGYEYESYQYDSILDVLKIAVRAIEGRRSLPNVEERIKKIDDDQARVQKLKTLLDRL